MLDLADLIGAVDGNHFDEKPVALMTFVNSQDYLNMPRIELSEVQQQLIKACTQIYKRSTLVSLYGFEEGERMWTETFNEIIMQLGKGSGKDFSSEIACAYLVYKLLCLTSPAGTMASRLMTRFTLSTLLSTPLRLTTCSSRASRN